MSESHEDSLPGPKKADLDAAWELLGRARRYLEQCRKDPRDRSEAEDPEDLLEELTSAMDTVDPPDAAPPAEAEEVQGKGRIRRIHRRRSA